MSRIRVVTLFLALLSSTFGGAAVATNLLPNGGFDTELAPWTSAFVLPISWSSLDADGSPSSGSILVTNNLPGPVGAPAAYSACVAVAPGLHEMSIDVLLPLGQGSSGGTFSSVRLYSTAGCFNQVAVFSGPGLTTGQSIGEWTRRTKTFTVPDAGGFIKYGLDLNRDDVSGTLSANFDNAQVCRETCSGPTTGVGDFFTDTEYPNFRFRVTIFRAGEPPLAGTKEAACLEELVCVSGALPGRAEVFLRIVGPRPNGFLWPTVLRSTSSGLLVEIEQISSGVIRSYVLNAVPQGDITELSGLQDRLGFLP